MGAAAVAVVAAWRAWVGRNAIGLALAFATMASRAAVRSRSLVTFDAGLHANAILRYDIPSGHPHPPGYPLSVAAGRLIHVLAQDPVAAMTWLSILWTGLTVFLLWRLGDRLGGRGTGTVAAVLFAVSPLALLHGATGLTYSADAAMGLAVAAMAWYAAARPDRRRMVLLGATFAAAVGVRPSLLLFLGPVALWPAMAASAAGREGLRGRLRSAATIAAAALACALAWLLPMLAFGGGPKAILAADRVQSATVVLRDPVWRHGWPVVADNVGWLGDYARPELRALPWLLGAAAVACAAAGLPRLRAWSRDAQARVVFLALWSLPALLFYALVYVGWPVHPPGYLMVVLPPAVLGVALAIVPALRAARWQRGPRRWLAPAAVALLLAIPLAHAPGAWHDGIRPAREADAWAASWAGFDDAFPPATSAIVMMESWPHVKLHHPDHLAWVRAHYEHQVGEAWTRGIESRHGIDEPRWFELIAMDPDEAPVHAIPPWVERIVLHEGHPATGPETLVKGEVELHEARLPTGRAVRWFEPRPEWRAIESYFPDVDPAWAEARLAEQEGAA